VISQNQAKKGSKISIKVRKSQEKFMRGLFGIGIFGQNTLSTSLSLFGHANYFYHISLLSMPI
jgi:hypothetical protein